MGWSHILIAWMIFGAAAASSHISNRLYYAMYDHHATEAATLAFLKEILTWGIAIYIIGDLLITRSAWAVLYVVAAAAGEAWRTGIDCHKHGRSR